MPPEDSLQDACHPLIPPRTNFQFFIEPCELMGAGKDGTLGPLRLQDLQPGGQLQLSFRVHMAAAGQVAMCARLSCTDAQVHSCLVMYKFMLHDFYVEVPVLWGWIRAMSATGGQQGAARPLL